MSTSTTFLAIAAVFFLGAVVVRSLHHLSTSAPPRLSSTARQPAVSRFQTGGKTFILHCQRVAQRADPAAVSGLTRTEAEEFLEWLEAGGRTSESSTSTDGGFK